MSNKEMQTKYHIENPHLKNTPFGVPNTYFDLLPQQVGQQIAQMSKQETFDTYARFSVKKSLFTQLALAASFVLMIGMGYGIVRLITPPSADTDLFDIEPISLFNTYTLLQNDEWAEPLDAEQIVTFLTEHGISPYAIAYLD